MIRNDFSEQGEFLFFARQAEVKGFIRVSDNTHGPNTRINLEAASCDVLIDDFAARPLAQGNLRLDGFIYQRLQNPGTARARLEWLRCQLPADDKARRGSFRPQPYRRLAQTLRAQSDDSDARSILIGMAEDRRKYARLGWHTRFWNWLLWHVMRNGYRPMRAVFWLLAVWIISYVVFGIGYDLGLMGPTDEKAYTAFVKDHRVSPNWYTSFRAPVYAIDISLPIISLGQRDKWQPLAHQAEGEPNLSELLTFVEPGSVSVALEIWRWIAIVLGWFFASMLVAGVTGLVARES